MNDISQVPAFQWLTRLSSFFLLSSMLRLGLGLFLTGLQQITFFIWELFIVALWGIILVATRNTTHQEGTIICSIAISLLEILFQGLFLYGYFSGKAQYPMDIFIIAMVTGIAEILGGIIAFSLALKIRQAR